MADRGNYSRGGGRGGSRGDYRGGRGGARGGGHHGGGEREQREPKKRDNILDLAKYMDKAIRVKFTGGREGKCGLCLCLCLGWSGACACSCRSGKKETC